MTSAIPVQRSNQLSYQANWELVIKLVRNIPGKDEDEIMNTAISRNVVGKKPQKTAQANPERYFG